MTITRPLPLAWAACCTFAERPQTLRRRQNKSAGPKPRALPTQPGTPNGARPLGRVPARQETITSLQDAPGVRQVESLMSELRKKARALALSSTLSESDALYVALRSEGLAVSMDAFAKACANLANMLNVSVQQATRSLADSMQPFRLPKRLVPDHARYLPPAVRTIVRLGQQHLFTARFDATRSRIRGGRVYLPLHIVTTIGHEEIAFVGERRWARTQIDDWRALGFSTLLYRGDNDGEFLPRG